MVVDVHSHYFRDPEHFAGDFASQAKKGRTVDFTVRWPDYAATATHASKTVVFGGKAHLSGLWVPDQEVAEYVKAAPERLIGFLSLDPTQPGWQDELEEGHRNLGLKGIKLMPMYAGFSPNSPELDYLWQYAIKHSLPVLCHTGTTFVRQAPLKHTLPVLIDDVAIRFPEARIIMAHLSHPYEGECVVTIRKHPHVYADCSALHYRPFQLYHSLMLLQEYGVWNKLLFGSDYPFTTVDASITGMRNLNRMVEGTGLPRLNMEEMESMFERKSLELLGVAS
jgi:predicted TIM-barrel fold metal-dependent hydrolase